LTGFRKILKYQISSTSSCGRRVLPYGWMGGRQTDRHSN